MSGRRRIAVSREDTCAVMVRRRRVNAYCRACPRQVVEKHHFLTPDTPVVDTLELPSHMLRDNTTTTSSISGRPISGSDGQNCTQSITQVVPSCNLDPVSMDLTCSVKTNAPKSSVAPKSINDKLNFLKRTLAHELCRMSSTDHTDTHSTPTALPSTPEPADTSDRVRENESVGQATVESNVEPNVSEEVESVHLVSCENSLEKSSSGKKNAVGGGDGAVVGEVGDIGAECEVGDIGAECEVGETGGGCEVGDGCGGEGEGSECEIEVARGAEEDHTAYLSPQTAFHPIHISPDLPEMVKDVEKTTPSSISSSGTRKKYSIDLHSFCGLSKTNNTQQQTDSGPGNRKIKPADKRKNKRIIRTQHNSPPRKITAPSAASGKQEAQTVSIRRKRKRNGSKSVTSGVETQPEGTGVECDRERGREGERDYGSVSPESIVCSSSQLIHSGENSSLDDHFNQLQITPILPPSHPHTLTKSRQPLTSTPTQQQEYPLTSTPILSDHPQPPPPANSITEIFDSELQGENGARDQSSSNMMGSTTERLMDFEMMPYQASTVLDLSSLLPQITPHTSHSHRCRSKTILSRAWKNRVKNTRQSTNQNSTGMDGTKTTHQQTRPNKIKKRKHATNESQDNGPKPDQTVTGMDGTKTTHQQTRPNKTKKRKHATNESQDNGPKPDQTGTSMGARTTHHQTRPKRTKRCKHTTNRTKVTKAAPTTGKRHCRQYIIPPALRPRRKRATTSHTLRTSLTPDIPSSLDYPECILVSHKLTSAIINSNVLTLTPVGYISDDSSSAIEDILTKP